MTGAGAGAGALLDFLPLLHWFFELHFLPPFFHFLCVSDLPDLRSRRRPDFSPLLSHQRLGGHAQMLRGSRTLNVDPLDVVHGVWFLLELTRVLASSGFTGSILFGFAREGLVSLQLALMAHGERTANDEDQNNKKRGNNDDDEQVLLQEVHHSAQDKIFQADHGGGDGVGEAGRRSGSRDFGGRSCGKGGGENELQLGFVAAAVHRYVVEQRTAVAQTAAQPEQSRTRDGKNQLGLHRQRWVLQQQQNEVCNLKMYTRKPIIKVKFGNLSVKNVLCSFKAVNR